MATTTWVMLLCFSHLFVLLVVLRKYGVNHAVKVSATKHDFDRSYEGHGSTILTQLKEDWEEYLLKMQHTAGGYFSLYGEITNPRTVQRMDKFWWASLGYEYVGRGDMYSRTV